MELQTARPPPPPPCLVQRYASSQKGGTLIAGDVMDLESHKRRICDPDGYRPCSCSKCGYGVLHVHDYRWRVLRAEPGSPDLKIIRYVCTQCEAVWRVLPGFMARCLWRSWAVVETAIRFRPDRSTRIPGRTVRRWASRLNAYVGPLASLLVGSDAPAAHRVAEEQMRRDLAMTFAGDLAALAIWIHRLVPGARLM